MRNSNRGWAVPTVLTLSIAALSCRPSPDPDTRAADEAAIRAADIGWSNTYEAR